MLCVTPPCPPSRDSLAFCPPSAWSALTVVSRHARARPSRIRKSSAVAKVSPPCSMAHLGPQPKITQLLVKTRLPQVRLGE